MTKSRARRRRLKRSRLDKYRLDILSLWVRGLGFQDIARELERRRGVQVSSCSVRRRLRRWCAL